MQALHPAAEFDYSPRVRELFASLDHAGELSDADATASAGSLDQGAVITLQVKVMTGVMTAVRYHAYGCPHFMAACEQLARWLQGRPINEITQWSWREVEAELQVPSSKRARLLLLEDALREIERRLG